MSDERLEYWPKRDPLLVRVCICSYSFEREQQLLPAVETRMLCAKQSSHWGLWGRRRLPSLQAPWQGPLLVYSRICLSVFHWRRGEQAPDAWFPDSSRLGRNTGVLASQKHHTHLFLVVSTVWRTEKHLWRDVLKKIVAAREALDSKLALSISWGWTWSPEKGRDFTHHVRKKGKSDTPDLGETVQSVAWEFRRGSCTFGLLIGLSCRLGDTFLFYIKGLRKVKWEIHQTVQAWIGPALC